MDNVKLNITGESYNQLEASLRCAMLDDYGKERVVKGFLSDSKKGLVIFFYSGKINDFLTPLTSKELSPIVWKWLNDSKEAKSIREKNEYGEDSWYGRFDDSDVSFSEAFRVYTESWGKVEDVEESSDSFAILPTWGWTGK